MDLEAANPRPSTRQPQLNALKTFEVAARHESFVRAAQELFVTHGAVSKQIRALEAELGESLFTRRNRAVFLTERGRQLSASLSIVFSDLADAIDDFRSHRHQQPLVVSCEPTLCLKLLIPKLADLKNRTGLDVRVMAAGGDVDFRRDHVDLAIRRNDFPIAPDIHARTLAPEVMGLVCSPAVAAEIASGSRTRFPALHTRSRPDAWPRWKRKQATSPKLKGDIAYEHFYLAIEATLASQGVALASLHMVAADIEQGRLRAISAFEPDGTAYLALTHRAFAEDARLSAFAEWFASVMAAAIDTLSRASSVDTRNPAQSDEETKQDRVGEPTRSCLGRGRDSTV